MPGHMGMGLGHGLIQLSYLQDILATTVQRTRVYMYCTYLQILVSYGNRYGERCLTSARPAPFPIAGEISCACIPFTSPDSRFRPQSTRRTATHCQTVIFRWIYPYLSRHDYCSAIIRNDASTIQRYGSIIPECFAEKTSSTAHKDPHGL